MMHAALDDGETVAGGNRGAGNQPACDIHNVQVRKNGGEGGHHRRPPPDQTAVCQAPGADPILGVASIDGNTAGEAREEADEVDDHGIQQR